MSFIEGYVNPYDKGEKKQVLLELREILNSKISIPWMDFNEFQLAEIRSKYINPIFDELEKIH